MDKYYKKNRKEIAAKVGMALGLISVAVAGSSCSGNLSGIRSSEHGYINIQGDAEGMRAYNEGIAGLITNSKAESNASDTPFYELQRHKEQTKRIKYGLQLGLKKGGTNNE